MVIDYSTLTLKSTCTCSNTDFASEHTVTYSDVFRVHQLHADGWHRLIRLEQ